MKTEIQQDFPDRLVSRTERLLTYRAGRIERKRRKLKARGIVMEWVDAFLWAVMVVLLLNQYLLQAYQIPSGSMRSTLIGGRDPYTGVMSTSDRIFVNKFIFGPELLPGVGKLPGLRESRRGEVIIFENPEYESPSMAYEIAQRVLYMMTLSFVDLSRLSGDTAHHFLIKRQVAQDGDRVNFLNGELLIRAQGEALSTEASFKELSMLDYNQQILLYSGYYEKNAAVAESVRLANLGLSVRPEVREAASQNWLSPLRIDLKDRYEAVRLNSIMNKKLYPQDPYSSREYAVYKQGVYVPENWILPLGDNRSNSQDGRYFGPIPSDAILGRALFIYWPFGRAGLIR